MIDTAYRIGLVHDIMISDEERHAEEKLREALIEYALAVEILDPGRVVTDWVLVMGSAGFDDDGGDNSLVGYAGRSSAPAYSLLGLLDSAHHLLLKQIEGGDE